jgi:hypothetical protein
VSSWSDRRSPEGLKEDIANLLGDVRAEMNAAAAAFVFMHGGCGGDCTHRRAEATADLADTFSTAMAKAAAALSCIPNEVETLIRACQESTAAASSEPVLDAAAE